MRPATRALRCPDADVVQEPRLLLSLLRLLQVMLYKSETSRSRVPHVSMRDIKVG